LTLDLVRLVSTLKWISDILEEEETKLRSSWSISNPLHDTHFVHGILRLGTADKGYLKEKKKVTFFGKRFIVKQASQLSLIRPKE